MCTRTHVHTHTYPFVFFEIMIIEAEFLSQSVYIYFTCFAELFFRKAILIFVDNTNTFLYIYCCVQMLGHGTCV